MCEPLTIAALGLQAVGTAVGAVGEGQQAQFQQNLALRNQTLARMQAADATARGEQDVGDAQLKAGRALGQVRTAIGGSGLEQSGTALNVLADARMLSAVDQSRIRANAAREAWGYGVQADNYGMEAEMAKRRGQNAVVSTILGGLGREVFGAADVVKRKGN